MRLAAVLLLGVTLAVSSLLAPVPANAGAYLFLCPLPYSPVPVSAIAPPGIHALAAAADTNQNGLVCAIPHRPEQAPPPTGQQPRATPPFIDDLAED